MNSLFVSFFILFLLVGLCQANCPSTINISSDFQPIVLSSYNISSQCSIRITVPLYSSIQVFVQGNLTGDNKVTIQQNYPFGSKVHEFSSQSNDQLWTLASTDFTINVNVSQPSVNETFNILIIPKDVTPSNNIGNFDVEDTYSFLIDSPSLLGNSTYSQIISTSTKPVSIRVALFVDSPPTRRLMENILIYDSNVFQGSLYDVLVASQTCFANNLRIVNTNSGIIPGFTIIISHEYGFGQTDVVAISHPEGNSETFTATNGLTVVHDVTSYSIGPVRPMTIDSFQFSGNGTLTVYAGCVTKPIETLRIATITNDNSNNYKSLLFYGKCRTYVLSRGVVTISKTDENRTNYKMAIGTKGVIMNAYYPYPNQIANFTQNYLIQSPDSNTAIGINYDIANISRLVGVTIQQDVKAYSSNLINLTSSDSSTNIQVSPSYQQLISLTVPINSTGCLIRFEIVKSSSISSMFLVFASLLIYLLN